MKDNESVIILNMDVSESSGGESEKLRDIFASSDSEDSFIGFGPEDRTVPVSDSSDDSSPEFDSSDGGSSDADSDAESTDSSSSSDAYSEPEWGEDLRPSNMFNFDEAEGAVYNGATSEMDFFSLYFPAQLIAVLVVQTNL
jgi:hypothetical protein